MEFILDFPMQLSLKGDDYVVLRPDCSEDEFWQIANEDTNFELIDGMLVIHSPASIEHEDIFGYLYQILRYYLEETGLGRVFGSRLVMHLSTKWNPEPDLMIILSENENKIQPTHIEGPADLVIEILSQSTREIDLTKKVPYYLEMGVKEIWIVDPLDQEFSLITASAKVVFQDPTVDNFCESHVLPNLNFNVKWIWNRIQYPLNVILKEMGLDRESE